jgi:hypothetical protein
VEKMQTKPDLALIAEAIYVKYSTNRTEHRSKGAEEKKNKFYDNLVFFLVRFHSPNIVTYIATKIKKQSLFLKI